MVRLRVHLHFLCKSHIPVEHSEYLQLQTQLIWTLSPPLNPSSQPSPLLSIPPNYPQFLPSQSLPFQKHPPALLPPPMPFRYRWKLSPSLLLHHHTPSLNAWTTRLNPDAPQPSTLRRWPEGSQNSWRSSQYRPCPPLPPNTQCSQNKHPQTFLRFPALGPIFSPFPLFYSKLSLFSNWVLLWDGLWSDEGLERPNQSSREPPHRFWPKSRKPNRTRKKFSTESVQCHPWKLGFAQFENRTGRSSRALPVIQGWSSGGSRWRVWHRGRGRRRRKTKRAWGGERKRGKGRSFGEVGSGDWKWLWEETRGSGGLAICV